MKILLITDQHFGVRNDNQVFIDKYKQFYGNVVLPTIDKLGITQVICLGDTFDKRKSINFNSFDAAREMWFDPLRERGVQMTMLVGNHDIYYKNTLRINAPELLLGEYDNIDVITSPSERNFGDVRILLLPWICDENGDRTTDAIESSSASVCMGHLELNGFEALPGHTMEHGDDPSVFSKFDLVCSGHFHMKSRKNQINYLGNPYQLYWNDYGQRRGFHILNTDNLSLKFYKNPYTIFNKIYYDDSKDVEIKDELKGSFVKLIVVNKTDQVTFDKTIRYIQKQEVADLKIVEDYNLDLEDVDESVETEDTLTTLEKCVSEMENKDSIFPILKSLYLEALEL